MSLKLEFLELDEIKQESKIECIIGELND